ncbi:hypothetical protein CIL05_06955 [Virgibacillus profundi]|uniref:Uncharacterized protein n=1 Tax=Virgibacillus profundi TaxID=2024555 RepID=A0A2A2IFQ8_9BACI|nr:hypothetical protein [Virgibacillus profundi]PAV30198.1 hypothetical protein CIL05_06955 [Virgibacillus profundi]PXY54370.1 hypothetical protein CIT14_07040 [Virgibacillus profundi]
MKKEILAIKRNSFYELFDYLKRDVTRILSENDEQKKRSLRYKLSTKCKEWTERLPIKVENGIITHDEAQNVFNETIEIARQTGLIVEKDKNGEIHFFNTLNLQINI